MKYFYIFMLLIYASFAYSQNFVKPKVDDGIGFTKTISTNDILVNAFGVPYSSGDALWGSITGNIENQSDLWSELTNRYTKSESDSLYVQVETDPLFTDWLETNTYVKANENNIFSGINEFNKTLTLADNDNPLIWGTNIVYLMREGKLGDDETFYVTKNGTNYHLRLSGIGPTPDPEGVLSQTSDSYSLSGTNDIVLSEINSDSNGSYHVSRGKMFISNTNNNPVYATSSLTFYKDTDRNGYDAYWRIRPTLIQNTISSGIAAEVTVIPVDDVSGFSQDNLIYLSENGDNEFARIQSIDTGNNTITVEDPITFAYSEGALISKVVEFGGFVLPGNQAIMRTIVDDDCDVIIWLETRR